MITSNNKIKLDKQILFEYSMDSAILIVCIINGITMLIL
jgi:hypothetical protein